MLKLSNTDKNDGLGVGALGKQQDVYHSGPTYGHPTVKPKTREEADAATRLPEERGRKVIRNMVQGAGIPLGAGIGGGLGYALATSILNRHTDLWPDDAAFMALPAFLPGAIGGGYLGYKIPRLIWPLAKDIDKKVDKYEDRMKYLSVDRRAKKEKDKKDEK